MDNLGKKVGYLKGLMEGLDFSDRPNDAKLWNTVAELLGDLTDRVDSLDEMLDDLNDYVESIDDDLSELEGTQDDEFSTDDEDDFEDDFEGEFEDGEDQLHLLNGHRHEADDDDETETLAGSICPECGRMFFVDVGDSEDAKYVCPHCKKTVTAIPLTPENAPIAHPVDGE